MAGIFFGHECAGEKLEAALTLTLSRPAGAGTAIG